MSSMDYTTWTDDKGQTRDSNGYVLKEDGEADWDAMRQDGMAFEEAVAWFEQHIAPQVLPELFWKVSSIAIDEHGNVKAKRKGGRPRGSRDTKQRTRRWAKRPDPNQIITSVERDEDGTLHTTTKTVGEVAANLRKIMDEEQQQSETSNEAYAGKRVATEQAQVTSTPVDVLPDVSPSHSDVGAAHSVAQGVRLNFGALQK